MEFGGHRQRYFSIVKTLNSQQTAEYYENGFVEVPEVFGRQELTRIDAEIDQLRADEQQREGQSRNFILGLGLRSPITRALCEDERLLTLIEDLVQPGIAIYSAKMSEKLPHDDNVCHWHQDDAYYSQKSASDCRMSIWIPLQDCDVSNGCVWMVPGSHRRGLREWEKRAEGSCALAFADGRDEVEGAVPCPIRAGSVLLFHALTWHRSLGNSTDATRRSFIISYQDALAQRGNGAQHRIVRPAPARNANAPIAVAAS